MHILETVIPLPSYHTSLHSTVHTTNGTHHQRYTPPAVHTTSGTAIPGPSIRDGDSFPPFGRRLIVADAHSLYGLITAGVLISAAASPEARHRGPQPVILTSKWVGKNTRSSSLCFPIIRRYIFYRNDPCPRLLRERPREGALSLCLSCLRTGLCSSDTFHQLSILSGHRLVVMCHPLSGP